MTFKKTVLFAITVASLGMMSAAANAAAVTCASKQQSIEEQIQYAQQHNNTHRIAGLQKALSEVKSNCTEAGLRADLQKDVKEKQQKVAERQQELSEAQQTGKTDKISKKEKKLLEAQDELKEAQQALGQ